MGPYLAARLERVEIPRRYFLGWLAMILSLILS
jgi:hypothetical protein